MKNKRLIVVSLLSFSLILSGIFLSSCNEEEPPENVKGSLSLELVVDASISIEEGRLAEVATDNFKVIVYNQADQAVATFENFIQMPDEVELDAGSYYVVAHSNNEASAAFENPYYYGESSVFEVKEKQVVPVSITCEQYNFGISVVYSDYVVSNFDSYSTEVKNASAALNYAGDETRVGYFEIAPLTITATLIYTKSDDSQAVIEVTGSIDEPVRKTNYIITIDANLNGSISPIEITVDETTSTVNLSLQNFGAPGEPVTDIDGNEYKTVTIGFQTWMAENLNTTRLNDGTAIPNITNLSEWAVIETPAYIYYDNSEILGSDYEAIYGALYNWNTVQTGLLCPTGYHVPSFDEWGILLDFLGGGDAAAYKLIEKGNIHWQGDFPSNTKATNESGFTALPGGILVIEADIKDYYGVGTEAYWWSSTENPDIPERIMGVDMTANRDYILRYNGNSQPKEFGLSVRCLKD